MRRRPRHPSYRRPCRNLKRAACCSTLVSPLDIIANNPIDQKAVPTTSKLIAAKLIHYVFDIVCYRALRYKAISPHSRRTWYGDLSFPGTTRRAVGHGSGAACAPDDEPVSDGLSTDTHHRTRATMEPGGLGVVLDRSHPACPAVLDPGHRGSRDWQRGGLASCPSHSRGLFRTLPDPALALLCQPL